MTEINRIDRSVIYQEFKEWIVRSEGNEQNQEIFCFKVFKWWKKIKLI